MIDWKQLDPTQFEELCYELLEHNGFKNIEWYGKGGSDKGRDLTAIKIEEPLSGIQTRQQWLIQCKRYTSKVLSKGDINDFLVAAQEHSPDVVLLIVTATFTADVRDWLKSVRMDYKFKIYTWEEKDLQREISRHRFKLSTPITITPVSGEPLIFYNCPQVGVTYTSLIPGKFEEIGFYILNDRGPKANKSILREFVDFIRHNEIDFGLNDEDSSTEY
jgi:Restriction endonuclease